MTLSTFAVFALGWFLGVMFGIAIGRQHERTHAYDPLRQVANELSSHLKNDSRYCLSVIFGPENDDDDDDNMDPNDDPLVGVEQNWENQ